MIRFYIRWETSQGEHYSPEFFTSDAALWTVKPVLEDEAARNISLMRMDSEEGWTVELDELQLRKIVEDWKT
jgi:hypothetical protein